MERIKKLGLGWSDLIIVFLCIGIFANYQLTLSIKQTHLQQLKIPNLQFAMIIKDSEDPYWKDFKNGADKAASLYQTSLETTYLEERGQIKSEFDERMLIDKATVANVDGIITFVNQPAGCEALIDLAAERNIPVITLENDVPNSKRASFVGYNAYRVGQESGKKMAEALAGKGKIAIVMTRNENTEQSSQNLKIAGFLNEINQSPSLEVADYIISESGIYSTQDIVSKLIKSKVPVDGLFITNSVETEAIAQLLVDNNLVGEYEVIGSGNSEEIKGYVNKRIIYASIYVNAYEMGYKTVETLAKIKNNEPVPSYVDTTIGILSGDSGAETGN